MEEVGSVSVAKTKLLQTMYVYQSVRQPGHVYEFTKRREDYYQCAECRKLGKTRTVVIRNEAIVLSTKHPEDDHHPECRPKTEIGTVLPLID